ncbi:hypothetical protein CA54_32130 [Symmachiella macrocystis]|uniref:Uncharacterized protein n=1 Tax=Symmachiella macrocystis TaxID=2527985 RepID=A0A5C6BQN6_9PLAN|nr:hypothetical protein [Symmachiella macrocystis]TWU14368.1 hypothetical protein CA54_32130 [Symmachiella macrocystis]
MQVRNPCLIVLVGVSFCIGCNEAPEKPADSQQSAPAPPVAQKETPPAKTESPQKRGWVSLSATSQGVETISALPVAVPHRFWSKIDPDQGIEWSEQNLRLFRRTFSMDQTTFLLGEPILVRFQIEFSGDGEWEIDDWFYVNNRDETFIILMRDEHGNWLPDRFDLIRRLGGGHGPDGVFSSQVPEIHYLPVQQYCAVTEPGQYEIFCMKQSMHVGWDNQYPPSPLAKKMPPDVLKELKQRNYGGANSVTDFAKFKIHIKQWSPDEYTRMIQKWTDLAAAGEDSTHENHRDQKPAIRRAWRYSLQNDFLPQMQEWNRQYTIYEGHPFQRFYIWEAADAWRSDPTTRAEAAEFIPQFIEDLTAESDIARSTAEFHLRAWTKQSFGHDWQGHRPDRPTSQEGEQMQVAWKEWWEKNRDSFVKQVP